MITGYFRLFKKLPLLSLAGLFVVVFSNHGFANQQDSNGSALSNLKVVELVEQEKGGYSDLFIKLKESPDFLRLSNKHGLDDPAAWPTLKSRFILNLAELQQDMAEAESMIATADRRSGLSDKLISAEPTREGGREMKEKLLKEMDDLRQMLRLMEELETLFEEVAQEHALTGKIQIFNKPGQSFKGKVLFVDGNDLIVKRQGDGYYRVPARLLSRETKQKIINHVVSDWYELPFLQEGVDEENQSSLQLVAFNESDLYYVNESDALVFEPRLGNPYDVVSYQSRIEEMGDINSIRNWEERERKKESLEDLKAARRLNESRAEMITFYGERLGVQIPDSKREHVKEDVVVETEASENASEAEASSDEE